MTMKEIVAKKALLVAAWDAAYLSGDAAATDAAKAAVDAIETLRLDACSDKPSKRKVRVARGACTDGVS